MPLKGRRRGFCATIILPANGRTAAERMALTCIKWAVAAALCGALLAPSGRVAAQQATDVDVLAAKEAAQKSQWKTLEQLRARFAGHPLEAYPTYWLLLGNIDRANTADVQAFLSRYPDG